VLAAQNEMIEHLRMKQEEGTTKEKVDMVSSSMKEEMMQLMTRLGELEMALKMERIKCLEFEKDLLQERQNKRRALSSREEAPDGRRARSTGHALIVDLARSRSPTDNTTSSSGLPLSKKFNPRLMSSVSSKDRQASQETIDLMMLPAPIPGRRTIQPVQEIIQPVQETNQPVQQIIQSAPGPLHTLQFNRPGSYPRNIIRVERFNRTEQHVDFTVGNWKAALQAKGWYTPETPTNDPGIRASHMKQLASALKNHLVWWNNYLKEGIHEDLHPRFQYLQATFNIPKRYENPAKWLPHHHENPEHCLTHCCVSVWWYYDQAMRDIPGFGENNKSTSAGTKTNQKNNQPNFQPTWENQPNQQHQHNQPPQPRYSAIQENIAEAAAAQRQLPLHHHAPKPHEDMDDLDNWDIHYDDLMTPDQSNIAQRFVARD
jgi:hypothetical protein